MCGQSTSSISYPLGGRTMDRVYIDVREIEPSLVGMCVSEKDCELWHSPKGLDVTDLPWAGGYSSQFGRFLRKANVPTSAMCFHFYCIHQFEKYTVDTLIKLQNYMTTSSFPNS